MILQPAVDTWTCVLCNLMFFSAETYEAHRKHSHAAEPDAAMETEGDTTKTEVESFDLTQIPAHALFRLGGVFREGEHKYGRNNWRTGGSNRGYQLERANHALKHLLIYIHWLTFREDLGKSGEDHLPKVMWFCATQMELERLENEDIPSA